MRRSLFLTALFVAVLFVIQNVWSAPFRTPSKNQESFEMKRALVKKSRIKDLQRDFVQPKLPECVPPKVSACVPKENFDMCVRRVILYNDLLDWRFAFQNKGCFLDGSGMCMTMATMPEPVSLKNDKPAPETTKATVACEVEITSKSEKGDIYEDTRYFASSPLICQELVRISESKKPIVGGKEIFAKMLLEKGVWKAHLINILLRP